MAAAPMQSPSGSSMDWIELLTQQQNDQSRSHLHETRSRLKNRQQTLYQGRVQPKNTQQTLYQDRLEGKAEFGQESLIPDIGQFQELCPTTDPIGLSAGGTNPLSSWIGSPITGDSSNHFPLHGFSPTKRNPSPLERNPSTPGSSLSPPEEQITLPENIFRHLEPHLPPYQQVPDKEFVERFQSQHSTHITQANTYHSPNQIHSKWDWVQSNTLNLDADGHVPDFSQQTPFFDPGPSEFPFDLFNQMNNICIPTVHGQATEDSDQSNQGPDQILPIKVEYMDLTSPENEDSDQVSLLSSQMQNNLITSNLTGQEDLANLLKFEASHTAKSILQENREQHCYTYRAEDPDLPDSSLLFPSSFLSPQQDRRSRQVQESSSDVFSFSHMENIQSRAHISPFSKPKPSFSSVETEQKAEMVKVKIEDDYDSADSLDSPNEYGAPDCTVKEEEEDTDSTAKLVNVKCHVCYMPAGKHNYYGGRVCHSCRAFFRRSVLNNSHGKFACSRQNDCQIDSKSWKSCKKCRFQKCLDSGMKMSYILTGSECKTREVLRKQAREMRDTRAGMFDILRMSSTDVITLAEVDQFKKFVAEDKKTRHKMITIFYVQHNDVLQALLSALFFGSYVPYDKQRSWEDFRASIARQELMTTMNNHKMSNRDINMVLNKNLPQIFELTWAKITYDGQVDQKVNSRSLKKMLRCWADMSEDFRQVLEKLNYFSYLETLPAKPLSYDRMHKSPWAESQALEDQHRFTMNKVLHLWSQEFAVPMHHKDDVQYYLICAVLLFSTDGVKFENGQLIGELQHRSCYGLYRYFKFKYGSKRAMVKLGHAMTLCSLIREASEIKERRLPV